MTQEDQWIPTRHGGMRRSTRSSSGSRKPSHGTADETGSPERVANLEGTKVTTGDGTERHPDKVEAGRFESLLRDKFKLAWRERLGLPSCPYVIRWRFETPWGSIRLHHWLAPDDDRAKHDHPWSFVTFVLKGGYTDAHLGHCNRCGGTGDMWECNPCAGTGDVEVREHLRAPAVRYRPATHQHTVFPDEGGCWTIIVTGPKIRQWGFWVKGKFVKSYRYFYRFGHHPCD